MRLVLVTRDESLSSLSSPLAGPSRKKKTPELSRIRRSPPSPPLPSSSLPPFPHPRRLFASLLAPLSQASFFSSLFLLEYRNVPSGAAEGGTPTVAGNGVTGLRRRRRRRRRGGGGGGGGCGERGFLVYASDAREGREFDHEFADVQPCEAEGA